MKFFDPIDRHRIDISILHCPHHRDLFFNRDRVVLLLLEQFDDPLTAFETRFRLAFVADLIGGACYVGVTVLLYELFKP